MVTSLFAQYLELYWKPIIQGDSHSIRRTAMCGALCALLEPGRGPQLYHSVLYADSAYKLPPQLLAVRVIAEGMQTRAQRCGRGCLITVRLRRSTNKNMPYQHAHAPSTRSRSFNMLTLRQHGYAPLRLAGQRRVTAKKLDTAKPSDVGISKSNRFF